MRFLLIGTGILLVPTLLLALALRAVLWLRGRQPRRFWRRALLVHAALVPVHLLVTLPLVLGWAGSRLVRTRGDERGYAGPEIAADGTWQLQSRATLRADGALPPRETHAVRFRAADGVPLRAFFVPARSGPARCSAVLVHGLFRGALELEPVAAMLRDLGADVLLLELRNHGGSGHRPATFGAAEARDVVAAVGWLRAQPERAARPIVLFGVSLGTAAVALAAARLDDVGGLILDAPIDALADVAERMLGRRMGIPQPFRWLVLRAVELWSGFAIDDVRPGDALRTLDPHVPVLLIGGGEDERVPPEAVRALYEALPAPPERKRIWILEGAGHGGVWETDPAGYRRQLQWLLEIVARK